MSKEDEKAGESVSITTQRAMLTRFAKEQGFKIFACFSDDGYSGTNFERPAFKRMMSAAKNKKFDVIITKDLSRLGRDYTVTGVYLERIFPKCGIRFIALTDNYDSKNACGNDTAAIKNVINELYAGDISKKIRSAFEEKMKAGKYIGSFAPYGYLKSPEDKNRLIINEETAPVVRLIFELAKQRYRPKDIADYLNSKDIDSPAVYRCKKYPQCDIRNYSEKRAWTSAGVQKMLKNPVYKGNLEQHKTRKLNFKSKITLSVDKKERYIVENTHEAIIDAAVFEAVNRLIKSRRQPPKTDFKNLFSGIAKCADCGANLSITASKNKAKHTLECGKYKLGGIAVCTNHFTDYGELYEIVLREINLHLTLGTAEREKVTKALNKSENTANDEIHGKILRLNKRKEAIYEILTNLYEDKYLNKIPEERFERMVKKYDGEIAAIDIGLKEAKAQKALCGAERHKALISIIDGSKKLKDLTPEIVSCLIEKIEISQGEYINEEAGKIKKQKIKIYFKFKNPAAKAP